MSSVYLRVGHGLDPSMDWIELDPIIVFPCFFLHMISILTD